MPKQNRPANIRVWSLGIGFLLLFLLITVDFKTLQYTHDFPHIAAADMALSDRDKSYIDRYTDLTKWLIAVSYALLACAASKYMDEKSNPAFRSLSFSIGIGLLLLSLYSGFLSYQSVLIVLSSKPLWMLRSNLTSFPVAAQLWLLSGATIALAFAFFHENADSEAADVDHEKEDL